MADKNIPREIGSTGLRYTTDKILDDELAKDIRWPKSIETFDKMKSDPIIAGSLFMIKQYIRKIEWDIEPFGGLTATDENKEKANIVRNALFKQLDRSFDELMTDIITFIEYGFSFHEPTFKIHKGNIVWKDFPSRSVKTISKFNLDNRGNLKTITQCVPYGESIVKLGTSEKEIPYSRLLHFRTDSERNNPLGRSILKNAYRAWFTKSKLEYFESVGIEREMNGLPVIKIPSEYFAADPTEDPDRYAILQEFIKIGQNARNNEQACVIIPSDVDESGNKMFSFDLVASKGTRSIDTSKVIERYDYRIAQSMLTDFLLMGSTSTGSFALSDNKIGSFVQSLEAYLEIIAEQFNRKAIPDLYRRNGWDIESTCELVHKPVGAATLKDLGEFLQRSAAYITPDKTLENALRAKADLPDRDESELYISTPTATAQAISQRIGMTRSVDVSGTDGEGNGLTEGSDVDGESLADEIAKGIVGDYRGVS